MMEYPEKLKPNRKEIHVLEGSEYEIPVVDLTFKKWDGNTIENTFGGKPLVDYQGEPMFAELAVQKIGSLDPAWLSRWVETYACKSSGPYYFTNWTDAKLSQQAITPLGEPYLEELLKEISIINDNSYSGCWDVLVWKDKLPVFIELKRNGKDSIRSTQLKWLKAAIEAGLTLDNFMIVQWDFES